MNFVADEGIDRQIVERLRQKDYEVLYIAEMEPGISDEQVLSWANDRRAMLLTADKDFGELVYRQQRLSSGVILIRLAGLTPERKAAIVVKAINEHAPELPGSFAVIAPGTVRIRRPLIGHPNSDPRPTQ